MTKPDTIWRAHAACAVMGVCFADCARAIDVSASQLRKLLTGDRRLREETRRAIEAFFGEHASFVFGQTDCLRALQARVDA